MKKEIEEYWNWRSTTYHSELLDKIDLEIELWKKIFSEIIYPGVKIRALEVATGPGILAIALASLGHYVTAVDLSEEMLKKADANAQRFGVNIRFVHGDAENLPFNDSSFDFIVSKYLMWTLPHPCTFVKECRRVLVDGGIFATIDNVWENDTENDADYETRFHESYSIIKEKLPLYNNNTADRIIGIINDNGLSNASWQVMNEYGAFIQKNAEAEYAASYPGSPFLVIGEKIC